MSDEYELWPYDTMEARGINATDGQLERLAEWAEEYLLGREGEIASIIHGTPGPLTEEEADSLLEVGEKCEKLVNAIDEGQNQGGMKV